MISAEEIKALMAKDENGLLPCPFCKGHPKLIHFRHPEIETTPDTMCETDGCLMVGVPVPINDWNTRAYTPALSTLQTLLNQASEAFWQAKAQIRVLSFNNENDATEPTLALIDKTLAAIEPYVTKEGE